MSKAREPLARAPAAKSEVGALEGALEQLFAALKSEQAASTGILPPTLALELPLDGTAPVEALAGRIRRQLGLETRRPLPELPAGQVFDLRQPRPTGCESPDPRAVFVGYSPQGAPRFRDFAQWLLEIRHSELEKLYSKPSGLISLRASEAELTREVLPGFRAERPIWQLHGQVAAGLFTLLDRRGHAATVALTFQIVSMPYSSRSGRHFFLQQIGWGPDKEPLDRLKARVDAESLIELPWQAAIDWTQTTLAEIEESSAKTPAALESRVQGVLRGLAGRLLQGRRARERRTDHAEDRHQSKARPTSQALKDLKQATPDALFFDHRRGTLIVVAEAGRVHVWSPEGKLVTSVRYSVDAIAVKKVREIWRPAGPQELIALRQAVARPSEP